MNDERAVTSMRLPPASGASGNRQSALAKPTSSASKLAPLSPSQREPHYTNMPPASPVLLALRSPPTSPTGSARRVNDAECESDSISANMLETYSLRIHDALKKKEKLPLSHAKETNLLVSVPAKQRRVIAVPTLKRNTNNNKPTKNQLSDHDNEARHVNAGVYVLENRKTGHRYVGTTWDLRNAKAQSFMDLHDGVHPHRALATCFHLYGLDASGIVFRVLERVAVPLIPPKTEDPVNTRHRQIKKKKKTTDDPAFDVHAMETLLRKRQRIHERQIVRACALALVQRHLVRPFLARYFPVWMHNTLATPQELEGCAAAVILQSVVRMFIAKRLVRRQRRHRAALRIASFLSLCAIKRIMYKRRLRKRRHASASCVQHSVRNFLQRRRQARRMLIIRKWFGARTIQRVFRGHCGRVVVRHLRHVKMQEHSAIVLQAVARGFLVRCRLYRQRQAAWRYDYATMIQACWRGFFTRRFVFLPLYGAKSFTQRQEAAARRLQAFFRHYAVRYKLTHAAKQHALEQYGITCIHAAYKTHLAKKFGWAAMTYQLEQTSAVRIQRAMRRWFFFARMARLVAYNRRDTAARRLQRVYRGARGRRVARARRAFLCRHRAATRLQHLWRLYQAYTKLHAAIDFWRRDKSARLIQTRYRGFHRRQMYLVFRVEARRQRAATRIQSTFRSNIARRAWRRRLQLQRDGLACQDCGDAAAMFFSRRFGMELCEACVRRWHQLDDPLRDDDTILELTQHRRQERLVTNAQRVYREFQVRSSLRFGPCGFCTLRAVRIACRSCRPEMRTFCHTCDALFHKTTPARTPHLDRIRIEEHVRQQHAALVLQTHVRRYAHRHTITELRHRRETLAAVKIQKVYVSRRQRRHTRAVVAARYDLAFRQQQAAGLIQRRICVYHARCELLRLRARKQSAIAVQRVFRGHQARLETADRRLRRDAAVCIQRHVRGVQGRQRADQRWQEVEHLKQQTAAVVLQRHARGWLVRRRQWHVRQANAALVIQSGWRRNRATRVLLQLVHDRDERLRLEVEANEHERLVRQHEDERMAARRIQCGWRRHQARHQVAILRVGNARRMRLQQLTIWLAVERKSVIRIQKFVRLKWLTRVASASLILQSSVRLWLARRELRQLRATKKAAICIQRSFRYSRVKRKLTRLVSLESMAIAGTVGGWVELFDEDTGSVYYYNRETMASQWVKPPEMMGEAPDVAYMQHHQQQLELGESDPNEPPEWVEYWDESVGASYFYNTLTGEATWATPEGVTNNQAEDGGLTPGAWPPGAPLDSKYKYGEPKQTNATAYEFNSNQTEVESVDPAVAEAYYLDEHGNAYAYDYSVYGYNYGASMDPNANAMYAADAALSGASTASAYTAPPGEGFDNSLVDTSYDINYEIYMTQLQRDAEQNSRSQGE